MEIKGTTNRAKKMVHTGCCLLLSLLAWSYYLSAQEPVNKLYVKGGKMFIQLSKQSSDPALDSFISRYEFNSLELKRFVKSGFKDSLVTRGWKMEKESSQSFIISKQLHGYDDI